MVKELEKNPMGIKEKSTSGMRVNVISTNTLNDFEPNSAFSQQRVITNVYVDTMYWNQVKTRHPNRRLSFFLHHSLIHLSSSKTRWTTKPRKQIPRVWALIATWNVMQLPRAVEIAALWAPRSLISQSRLKTYLSLIATQQLRWSTHHWQRF